MDIRLPVLRLLIRTGIAQRLPMVRRLMPDPSYLRYYSDRVLQGPSQRVSRLSRFMGRAGWEIDLSLGAPSDPMLRPAEPDVDRLAGSRYPPATGLGELRQAIAQRLERHNQIRATPENEISVVNGASQALHVVFETFVNPGDRVLLLDPTFLVYPLLAQYHGARAVWVPTRLRGGETGIDLGQLDRAMGGAKMIILNSPANPTGGVLRRDTLLAVLDCARRYDTLIVSDEVYDQFLYDGSHVSMASLPGARERTITVNSFSKSHAMAGARIGYVTANEHLMRPMMMSQFVTTPFVPVRSQELALRALAEPRAKWRAVTDDYRSRRQLALDILHAAGLECPVPGGAFYIWLPVGSCGVSGRQFAERLLDEHGVLTMPGDDFGPSGQSYVRISYAVPRDELIEGLQRVVQLVADLRAESATSRPSTGWWRWLRGRAGSGGRVLQGPHAAQAARASGAAAPVQEGTVC